MIAGFDVVDRAADLFDHPRSFMTQHRRRWLRPQTVDYVQVAMAYAAGYEADQDFMLLRVVDLDLLDSERLMGTMKNGCFPDSFPV